MTTKQDLLDDPDWWYAFHEAYAHSFGNGRSIIKDYVTDVYYAIEGEHDQDSWIAIVGWSGPEGQFAIMDAGCDYTGWD